MKSLMKKPYIYACKGHIKVQLHVQWKSNVSATSGNASSGWVGFGAAAKHTRTHIHAPVHTQSSWGPSKGTFVLGAVCGGALFRVADGMLETAANTGRSYWISARRTTFFTVGASLQCFQVYSLGQRGTFLTCITLNALPPPPQPVQRMSYFKGRDGRLSQATSFCPSTRRTSARPSRARQKEVLLRSIGKSPHQSCVPHESRLFPLPPLNVLHTKKLLLLNCLWIFSAAFMAIKEVIDSADCHWFVIERFQNINVGQRLGAIRVKGRLQSVAA